MILSNSLALLVICLQAYGLNGAPTGSDGLFLRLALSWGPGDCKTGHIDCRANVAPKFTIHGLWPNKKSGKDPHSCDTGDEVFNIKSLSPIRQQLTSNWPTLTNHGEDGFWEHEYKKHGTCARNVKGISNPLTYFKTTLHLFESLDLAKSLEQNGLKPTTSRKYYGEDIEEAIGTNHDAQVQIKCRAVGGEFYLTEAYFCFDFQLEPINCPKINNHCSYKNLYILDSYKKS